jgi:hypothetical protein
MTSPPVGKEEGAAVSVLLLAVEITGAVVLIDEVTTSEVVFADVGAVVPGEHPLRRHDNITTRANTIERYRIFKSINLLKLS